MEDVEFLAQNKFRYSGWIMPLQMDCSDGLNYNVGTDWKYAEAAKRGLPMFFSYSYGAVGGANWMARRFGAYMEQPADFLQGGFYATQLFYKAQPQLSWHSRDAQGYVTANFMAGMQRYAGQPTTLGCMEPHGELSPEPWYFMHADYSRFAQDSWRGYLQKRGLDLPTLARMYARPDDPFPAWEQVPVPEFATFAGLPGRIAALEGEWFYRRENASPTPADAAWWALPAEQRYAGLREQWWNAPLDLTQWNPIQAPGSDALYGVFPAANPDEATTWFRRSFTLTPQQVARKPLYLYWFPISRVQQIHSGRAPPLPRTCTSTARRPARSARGAPWT